jgi:hypothetical protein
MKKGNKTGETHHIRLPGFVVENETGLGDIIKRATTAIGIPPCGQCEQRAALLNKWIVFNSKSK